MYPDIMGTPKWKTYGLHVRGSHADDCSGIDKTVSGREREGKRQRADGGKTRGERERRALTNKVVVLERQLLEQHQLAPFWW
jgi:hypothetical protein